MSISANELWTAVIAQAAECGLNPSKFGDQHRAIITDVANFLATAIDADAIVPTIIICGKPGTGKTTFLYVLDTVLRGIVGLPDNVPSALMKERRTFSVPKRKFHTHETSLLSVRKWAEMLNFMMWNQTTHSLIQADLTRFIVERITPMRVLLADEVEMEGYSPTLPDFGKHGILVIGTSNQYEFQHLNTDLAPPKIYRMEGIDLRIGDPEDAIVTEDQLPWQFFTEMETGWETTVEQFSYRAKQFGEIVFIRSDFTTTVRAPILETRWAKLITDIFRLTRINPQQELKNTILLLDEFDVQLLTNDYDSLIRFVSLFDAIEQLGIGVLVRNTNATPHLDRATIEDLKNTIGSTQGASALTKQRTLVGIDRFTSRLGQAGHQARSLLDSVYP